MTLCTLIPSLQERQSMSSTIMAYTFWIKIIQPDMGWIVYWNMVVAAVILYYIFEIGLVVFLGNIVWESELRNISTYIINILSIFILGFDIVVTLSKGYYDEGILVTDRKKIIKRYFPYQATIDIIGLFVVLVTFANGSYFLNYFKVLFFLKILNLYQIDVIFQRVLMSSMKLNSTYLIFRQIVMVLIAAHYYAVTYFALSKWIYETNHYGPSTPILSWVFECDAYPRLITQPWEVWYLYSLYFTIGVITTIAYGDITPLNPAESVYNIVFMTLCIVQFSYVIWNIIEILLMSRAAQSDRDNEYLHLKRFMGKKRVSSKTETKIKAFVEETWKSEMYRNRNIEGELLDKLPAEVKTELMSNIYQEILNGMFVLNKFPGEFVPEICNVIQEHRYSINQVVFSSSEDSIKTYYLQNGRVNLCYGQRLIRTINNGSLGVPEFYMDKAFPFQGVAQENFNLYEINKESFDQVASRDKRFRESVLHVVDLLRDKDSRLLTSYQSCFLCCGVTHYYINCPHFFFSRKSVRIASSIKGGANSSDPHYSRHKSPQGPLFPLNDKYVPYNQSLAEGVRKLKREELEQLDFECGDLEDTDEYIELTEKLLKTVELSIWDGTEEIEVEVDRLCEYEVYFPRFNLGKVVERSK